MHQLSIWVTSHFERWMITVYYTVSGNLPVFGLHVIGIGHPLGSNPPGHNILFSGQFDCVKGHDTGHSFPSVPIGPVIDMQVPGILQPLSNPPGHNIWSYGHVIGQVNGQSWPLDPVEAVIEDKLS